MAAYRFCRTDDIGLLVDALNRCWAPYFADESPVTPAAFKRSIRDLQVWCSSCMVAFSGDEPVGVLISAKRPSATLIHRIAVHPDHRRQGHARHLLASLSSKLAILGPPHIVAEVPETLQAACRLFEASGYVKEAVLTDYVWQGNAAESTPALSEGGNATRVEGREGSDSGQVEGWLIPVTVDDLEANGLLSEDAPDQGEGLPRVCWERSVETLKARKDEISGFAVVSDERIEAYVLHTGPGAGKGAEIVGLRTLVEDGRALLRRVLSRLGPGSYRFPKVHPGEISRECLDELGFRPAGTYWRYTARASAR